MGCSWGKKGSSYGVGKRYRSIMCVVYRREGDDTRKVVGEREKKWRVTGEGIWEKRMREKNKFQGKKSNKETN